MNEAAQQYWTEYWKDAEIPKSVSAWQLGDTPNSLAQQVVDGTKTATCSAYLFYELKNIPLPTTDDYSVILDHDENPVAIVKTIEVTIVPMNEITEEFAIAEGDESYKNWKEIHERYFRSKLNEVGHGFSDDILLVCERFRRIDIKK
ncbi:ASCH domain-containing protein [Bacillus sp. ES1-5]|uniref:ASCH domain-containing protein n=1 Tax=Bacillus sp. ES1-5 TaxID=1502999 RepID=UPI001F0B9997|nr:ASCH domain-containing protein [Bacillus sp. ES1-5]